MLGLENLSTEAKIGKVLILIALMLGALTLLLFILPFGTSLPFFGFGFLGFFGAFLMAYVIVKVIGLILGVAAFRSVGRDYRKASILAVISSLLPPIDIIMIIGAILLFISPECKGAVKKSSGKANPTLVNFFNKEMGKGYTAAQIKKHLIDSGYNTADVDAAAAEVSGSSASTPTSQRNNRNLIIIVAIIIIAIILFMSASWWLFAGAVINLGASIGEDQPLLVPPTGQPLVPPNPPTGGPEGAGVQNVQAVDHQKLIPFLPAAPAGWSGLDAEGSRLNIGGLSWSSASKYYFDANDNVVYVSITDGAGYYENSIGPWLVWSQLYEYESTDGYSRRTTVKGYPAQEIYTKGEPGEYSSYVALNNRFLVEVRAADKDTMMTFANSIDYAGIGAQS